MRKRMSLLRRARGEKSERTKEAALAILERLCS